MDSPVPANLNSVLQRISEIEAKIKSVDSTGQNEGLNLTEFAQVMQQNITSAPPSHQVRNMRNIPVANIRDMIKKAAKENNLRPELLEAVVQVESGYNPDAVSSKGAEGLMQLMPNTANALGVSDPFDPEQNLMGGAKYLRQQLDRFNGDEKKALAAYNAGPGAVLRFNGVPPYPETQNYVNKIMSFAGPEVE
ncbi:MAG: lytic transglycosylase domain-containing protein [bacterium]